MSMMRQAAQDYLTLRRALGFKLDKPGGLVLRFAEHLDRLGTCQVSVDLALRWAREPAQADPSWWAYRLSAVRGFTAYLQPRLPGIEVPPADLLPLRTKRATPYLYSAADVHALMVAARGLRSPLRAATYETLIGLLAVTGLRVGEAINLNRGDVDLAAGMLTVRNGKFGNSREVPLHPTTARALRAYAERRAQLLPAPSAANFFLSTTGTRLSDCRVESTFRALVRGAGLQPRSARCRPRLHDLRHSFTVATLLDWYRDGGDVAARLPLLCTYLGHVDPSRDLLVPAGHPRAAGAGPTGSSAGQNADTEPGGEPARPDPAGLLHRPAAPSAPGQPAHRRRLPRHACGCCSSSPQRDRQAARRPGHHRPGRRPDRGVPDPPGGRAGQQRDAPATPGWPRSSRCSATPRCTPPSTPR